MRDRELRKKVLELLESEGPLASDLIADKLDRSYASVNAVLFDMWNVEVLLERREAAPFPIYSVKIKPAPVN